MPSQNSIRRRLVGLTLIGSVVVGLLMMGYIPAVADAAFPEGKKFINEEKMVFHFNTSDQVQKWFAVNDGVMGGVSWSRMTLTSAGTAIFQGRVSLENNGGFASVRTYPIDYQLGNFEGFLLRVKGDGQRYKFRLRTNEYFDGIAYQIDFQTRPNTWLTIRVPFTQFQPVYRGFIVADAPPLDNADIAQMGFMISDKQAGPFQLEIDWIKAYSAPAQESMVRDSLTNLRRGYIP
jgi:monofunctional biosynthetic peptidoglycan transglycosylase